MNKVKLPVITNFAIDLDLKTKEQFENCFNESFVIAASLMPDAHVGYIAPIGSVFITENIIVPSWIGYDIGCGVSSFKLKFNNNNNNNLAKEFWDLIKEKFSEIYYSVNLKVPMGLGKLNHIQDVSIKIKDKFKVYLKEIQLLNIDSNLFKYIKNNSISNLGTLGSGNHFIEFGFDDEDFWIIIHSGSRNIGHRIAEYYMELVSKNFTFDLNKEIKGNFFIEKKSNLFKEYLSMVKFASKFAELNRDEMAVKIEEVLKNILDLDDLSLEKITSTQHNFIEVLDNNFIHRKGVISAKKNECSIIPANMKDGSFLVQGKGNLDFLNSASHGAGRILSRSEAKKKLSLNNFCDMMEGVVGNYTKENIDESPLAYKDISKVLKAQKSSIKVLKHIKPLINWKG